MSEDLLYTQDGAMVTLTLNRPEACNALSLSMRDGLERAVARVESDPAVKAVLIQGAGRHFCSGGDVSAMADGDSPTPSERLRRMRGYQPLISRLAQLDRPVVAAVDGAAFGAGFGLVLLADIVIMSSRARLCMAFQRVGLVPDFGATYTLPRAVGLQRARELMLTAREIGADEALRLGLALEVVGPEALDERARQVANALAQASPLAAGMTKRMLNASMLSSLPDMLEMESTAQAVAATSEYARAAFNAFAGGQPPPFQWPPPTPSST